MEIVQSSRQGQPWSWCALTFQLARTGKGETRGRFTTKSCVCVCVCSFSNISLPFQIPPGKRTFSVVVSIPLHSCLPLTCGSREGAEGDERKKRSDGLPCPDRIPWCFFLVTNPIHTAGYLLP